MNKGKGSKNAIENRGAKSVMICKTCGGERKPIRMLGTGKGKMGYECKCGILAKDGGSL